MEAERYAMLYAQTMVNKGFNDEDILLPERIREFVLFKQNEEA